jgi:predicted CXXCH cytochrome family protein
VGTTGTREKTDMILYRRATFTDGEGPSVECGSCHDPHNYSNPTFLRLANNTSNLCLSCHVK